MLEFIKKNYNKISKLLFTSSGRNVLNSTITWKTHSDQSLNLFNQDILSTVFKTTWDFISADL